MCNDVGHASTLYPFTLYPTTLQVQKLSRNEVLMVNIGSLSTGGRVSAVKADLAKIALTQPVCTEVGEKIALSRRVEKHWRYIHASCDVIICVYVCMCIATPWSTTYHHWCCCSHIP